MRALEILRQARGVIVHYADLRRKDHPAYHAVGVADRGVEVASKLVFWLKLNALLLGVLIVTGILNLVL